LRSTRTSSITGSSGSTRASVPQFRKTLSFLSGGRLSVKELVSGRFPLQEIKEALALAANAMGIKSIIVFDQEVSS
jgi:L-iditol 2-dehydrogenase